MIRKLAPVLAAIAFLVGPASNAADTRIPKAIAAAVADLDRPDADKKRDALRKPAEVLAFAGVKSGDKVADVLPGGGYFTRIFAKIVGPKGHVYAVQRESLVAQYPTAINGIKAIAADPAYSNVSVLVVPLESFAAPESLDLVWTSDNYHDLKNKMGGSADTVAMDKAIFAALKPGGIYIVLDHAGAPGSGANNTETLHRIDPALVKEEVMAAGFVLARQSDLLKNPEDDHSTKVSDAAVRDKTDQFIFKFRKPKK